MAWIRSNKKGGSNIPQYDKLLDFAQTVNASSQQFLQVQFPARATNYNRFFIVFTMDDVDHDLVDSVVPFYIKDYLDNGNNLFGRYSNIITPTSTETTYTYASNTYTIGSVEVSQVQYKVNYDHLKETNYGAQPWYNMYVSVWGFNET